MLELDPCKRPSAKEALVQMEQIKQNILESQVYEPADYN